MRGESFERRGRPARGNWRTGAFGAVLPKGASNVCAASHLDGRRDEVSKMQSQSSVESIVGLRRLVGLEIVRGKPVLRLFSSFHCFHARHFRFLCGNESLRLTISQFVRRAPTNLSLKKWCPGENWPPAGPFLRDNHCDEQHAQV